MENDTALQIVPFDPNHIAEVRTLSRQKLDEEWDERRDVTLEDDTHRIPAMYAPPDNRFVVAVIASRIVGMGAIRRISGTDCELRNLYVHSEHRRQGVASALVAELVPFARERSYQRILLELTRLMEPYKKLYKRYGFIELTDADRPPRQGQFMALPLH